MYVYCIYSRGILHVVIINVWQYARSKNIFTCLILARMCTLCYFLSSANKMDVPHVVIINIWQYARNKKIPV